MFRINLLSSVIILLLFSGCKNSHTNRDQVEGKDYITNDQLEEVKEVYYRFPSPDEMLNFIDHEKLTFDDEILLPVENSKSYLDSKSQEINLGVYIADLAYITLFQRQKEALIYFQTVYGLSDKLRISSALDANMITRYENNIKNLDSLRALGDEALTNITDYLARNDKERVFAVISIGGFIESLYLAFQLCGDYSKDNLILQRITDQKLVLQNLLNYSNEFKEDQNVADALKAVGPVQAIFNELVTSNSETKVTKDKSGKLIISGGEQLIINQEQFEKLRKVTFSTRKEITDNKVN
jgi:hypothetical protein